MEVMADDDSTNKGMDVELVGQGDTLDARGLFGFPRNTNAQTALLPVAVGSEVYNMNHPHRGKCLIFNNKVFDGHTKLNERRGTDVDAARLYHRFRELDFDTTLFNDKSVKEIKLELAKVAKENHSNNDCFLCCILTHGDEGILYGRDGKFRTDELFAPFRPDVCPSLAGKPKLYFIQACQGDRLDSGTTLFAPDEADSPQTYKIPNQADFLVAYSTVPGYYAWQTAIQGSWFVQATCAVLEKYGREIDLLDMLTIVNHTIDYVFENSASISVMSLKKQVPCISSMLTRKIFFPPKAH